MTNSGIDHEKSAAITEAAGWLATTPPRQRPAPLVPAMREMFGLSPVDVCEAIREANLIRARAT